MGLVLAIGLSQPSHAVTLLPHLFSFRYCALREIGASTDDALAAAAKDSIISGNNWIWVNFNGRQQQSDVVESYNAVRKRCPQYLP